MTHREYKLTVAKNILEYSGRGIDQVHYGVGQVIVVDQATWDELKKGRIVEKDTREGVIRYDKNNFENEVHWTEVTVTYGTSKLGLRND